MAESVEKPLEPLFPKENVGRGFSENCALDVSRRRPLVISQTSSGSREGEQVRSKSESSDSSSSSSDSIARLPQGDRNGGRDNQLYRELTHSWASVVGRRRDMEDGLTVAPSFIEGYDFFGVFDGHGGPRVAHFCQERMHLAVAEEVGGAEVEWEVVMAASFAKVDAEVTAWAGNPGSDQQTVGSTAVVSVVGPKSIVVANCGDSRAVLSRGGLAVPLSVDHKPDRLDELERIEAEGGEVINWNGFRVLGVLATSRSIGDYYLKPYVIPNPEVMIIERSERDEFIILASDGLWDVVSNEMACKVVRGYFRRRNSTLAGEPENKAATILSELALYHGSWDNITVVVVELKRLYAVKARHAG